MRDTETETKHRMVLLIVLKIGQRKRLVGESNQKVLCSVSTRTQTRTGGGVKEEETVGEYPVDINLRLLGGANNYEVPGRLVKSAYSIQISNRSRFDYVALSCDMEQ
jgi:hypothetical protein